MTEPRQRICQRIGEAGCYFLCIVFLGEELTKERIDAVEWYELAVREGIMELDCFVNDPGKLLGLLSHGTWVMEKCGLNYDVKDGELQIIRYERPSTYGLYTHFVVGDGFGSVIYDPLGDSQCVAKGKPVSYRIFRKTA